MQAFFLVALSILCAKASALKLAAYITPCSRNDPNLDECVVRSGRAAIPYFIHGDPKYGVPDLDPMHIDRLSIRQGTDQVGLKLEVTNCQLIGMSNTEFLKSRTNLKKRHIEWDFYNENGVQFLGDYKTDGKVLVLPITGTGKANLTVTKIKSTVKIDYDLVKRKGKEYMNLTTIKMTNEIGGAFTKLDNLFNGDKLLGENMNRFLNENWRELAKEFEQPIGGALAEVYRQLLAAILGTIPYDQVFPDTKV